MTEKAEIEMIDVEELDIQRLTKLIGRLTEKKPLLQRRFDDIFAILETDPLDAKYEDSADYLEAMQEDIRHLLLTEMPEAVEDIDECQDFSELLQNFKALGIRKQKKALKELESVDAVWEVFMAKNPYQRRLIKKCLYIRKTMIAGKEVYVAAITDLPEPPY